MDDAKLSSFFAAIDGKDVAELITEGTAKLATVSGGGGGGGDGGGGGGGGGGADAAAPEPSPRRRRRRKPWTSTSSIKCRRHDGRLWCSAQRTTGDRGGMLATMSRWRSVRPS